jgi:hypothetical protein
MLSGPGRRVRKTKLGTSAWGSDEMCHPSAVACQQSHKGRLSPNRGIPREIRMGTARVLHARSGMTVPHPRLHTLVRAATVAACLATSTSCGGSDDRPPLAGEWALEAEAGSGPDESPAPRQEGAAGADSGAISPRPRQVVPSPDARSRSAREPGSGAGSGASTEPGECIDGDWRDCRVHIGVQNGVRTCFEGVRLCVAGQWGPCQEPPKQ